jgi:hypothetical protein
MPLNVNVSIHVTLKTQQNLECHCKALFETPCIKAARSVYEKPRDLQKPNLVRYSPNEDPVHMTRLIP